MKTIKYTIPSYKRPLIIKTHTLAMLERYKIPKKQIYIFVANQEEYNDYNNSINDGEYKLIIGEMGLDKQRNFITNYFKEGQYIVNIDDDVKKIMILEHDKLKEVDNFQEHINKGFRMCNEYNSYIWGIHQTQNSLNLRNSITFDFSFIVGFFWGCINRHLPELNITMPIKEDYERTIKYWLKDKTIVKFNYLCAETMVYKTDGGLQTIYPDRTEMSNNCSSILATTYPEYFIIRNTQLNNANKSKYCELRCSRIHKSVNNYYKQLPLINKDDNIIKKIENILVESKLLINKKRLNSGVGVSQTFGKYRVRKRMGLFESKNNTKYPELYSILLEFYEKYVKEHLPEYTSIQVNKNYKTSPHIDKNNAGISYIIGLGDYKGGELIINSYKHDIHYKPLMFEGKKWIHSTNDFNDNRYSLVFFKLN
jgi:hypothetical protein